MTALSTPCIKVCVVDPVAQLCRGCGRTLDEIAAWGGLDEAGRRAIMALLPARLSGLEQPPISPDQPDRGAAVQTLESGAISRRPDEPVRWDNALEETR